ncbi:MAG: two-component sensor histidine kinase [Firmicutes bacterium HGW-Firmicutes-8]|nr:MAG: two-component sensor histidine kinase [Firmicutes bacterium HGW-Firmicutes-8]
MSIRTRLFLSLSALIVFFVILSVLLNSQFLGKYYISQKRQSLIESKNMIEGMYKGNPESISFELESIERNKGINISLYGLDNQMKYYSSLRVFDMGNRRRAAEGPAFMRPILSIMRGLSKGNFIIDVNIDPRLKTEFLILTARLSNGDILILSSALAAISESTAIANRFFLFTGLITIVLGGLAVFLYTRRFTKPILDLNDIAQRMSKLDFSTKYPVQTKDEIGQLGDSINSLSDQLDHAITDLTQANDNLKEDIERERRIDKMRKEFISNVSHELKTPIALIQGYSEGLKLNVNEDEENRNFYCDVIMDETDKMNRLVSDLLDLSQIESGNLKIEKSVFDMSSMVEHLLDKYRPILSEKQIAVSVKKDENVPVLGDRARIEQVLVNYLNNAVNHVDENKLITITVTVCNDKVRVGVFNSGKNIPEEALNKIWTSFYKVDKARTRAYGGTGLGLSVVKSIMELHQNAFGAENNNDGVTFWFELDKN